MDFVVGLARRGCLPVDSQIIYDFGYHARARELMISSTDAAAGRYGALPMRPGKVIAVHLSYPRAPTSAAVARTRRRTSSSRRVRSRHPDRTIERPAGTELLAFEGEIALVIGTDGPAGAARSTRGAMSRWVTASNDFGVYDLRANDKGSNVRSKGGDGFTPIGPDADRRPHDRPGVAAAAHLGERRRSRRTTPTARTALPPRAAGRRPLAALHARARRCDPHRNAGRVLRRGARRRRRGRGRRPAGASSGRLRHDR